MSRKLVSVESVVDGAMLTFLLFLALLSIVRIGQGLSRVRALKNGTGDESSVVWRVHFWRVYRVTAPSRCNPRGSDQVCSLDLPASERARGKVSSTLTTSEGSANT